MPRILDISLHDRSWWPDREVVLGKLTLANWGAWSPSEINALHTLFEAAFDEAVRVPEHVAKLDRTGKHERGTTGTGARARGCNDGPLARCARVAQQAPRVL